MGRLRAAEAPESLWPPPPERVKAALLDMIAAGGFADGRLPREEVLALELGVSRGTARAALRSRNRA